jgi:hypothetical protein
MQKASLSGTWRAGFQSPAGNLHDFHLVVRDGEPSVTLSMVQTKKTESTPSPSIAFETKATIAAPFIGLLSRDPDRGGFNCIALQLVDDPESLKGRIIWNSLSENRLQDGEIEFHRIADQK